MVTDTWNHQGRKQAIFTHVGVLLWPLQYYVIYQGSYWSSVKYLDMTSFS